MEFTFASQEHNDWRATVIPEFTYTGAYAIVDDNDKIIAVSRDNWKIKFLSSGILKFTNLRSAENGIDVFLLGGGGGGGASRDPGNDMASKHNGHPGGGGYYDNVYNISVLSDTEYEIIVGEGGSGGGYASDGHVGGSTTAFGTTVNGGDAGGNGWGSSAAGNHTSTNGFGIAGSTYSGTGTNGKTCTKNTGGAGGGGTTSAGEGTAGCSGIVIVRNAR